MSKKQTKLMKEKAGITLIALIITVIVMLILAGVAINLTVADNGIFKKSQEGAEIYKNSANNEATSLNSIDKEMGDLLNKYQGGSSTPTEKPDEHDIYTENHTINGGEPEAFNPEIPKGFKPKDEGAADWGDGTTPPTEEAVKAGLIIEDEEGNQFVWVAVNGTDVVLGRYVFTETGEIDTILSKTEPTEKLKEKSTYDYSYTEGLKDDTTKNTHAKDIEAFRRSVEEHGGYYIARYEASYGTDGKPNSKISTDCHYNIEDERVEGQLWNMINQLDAAEACRNMYDSSYGIESDLMNSYAWGTAVLFIQKYSGDTDYSRQNSLNRGSPSNTGENGDEKCHIHDMASNGSEWTTETAYSTTFSDNFPCVFQGGSYSRNDYTSLRGCR